MVFAVVTFFSPSTDRLIQFQNKEKFMFGTVQRKGDRVFLIEKKMSLNSIYAMKFSGLCQMTS